MRKPLITAGLFFLSTCAIADIQTGIDGHNPGDVIAVSTIPEIMAWCDFNKQIVLTSYTLCVYNGSKATPTPT